MVNVVPVDNNGVSGYTAASLVDGNGSYFPPASFLAPYQQEQWSNLSPDLGSSQSYHQQQNNFSPDFASSSWQQQQDHRPLIPEPEAAGRFHGFLDLGSNDSIGFHEIVAMQRILTSSAMLPAQMQTTPMPMQWKNTPPQPQPSAMAMQEEHRSFESTLRAIAVANTVHAAPLAAAATVHEAPLAADDHAVVPVDAPPALPAKRGRGRPRGSTAKSKSMLVGTSRPNKMAPRRAAPVATPTPMQEQSTEQPAEAATTAIVVYQNDADMEHPMDKRKRPEKAPAATTAIVVSQHDGELEHPADKKRRPEEALDAIIGADDDVQYADTSPPGVRFQPSDAEVIGFLKLKYLGRKMPVDIFKEFDAYQLHPDSIQERYGNGMDGAWYAFMSRNRKYGFGGRPSRSVVPGRKVGFWKSNTKETEVLVDGVAVGTVNMLTFEIPKETGGTTKTNWKMKEYRIPELKKQCDGVSMLLDPWVICKIYKSEGKKKRSRVNECVNPTEGGGEEDTAIETGTHGTGEEDASTAAVEMAAHGAGEEEAVTVERGRNGAEEEDVNWLLDSLTEEPDLCVEDYIVSPDDDGFL